MVRKKMRDADATKGEILEAAEKLFAEKGFAGTTLRDISNASGASGPLIVFHFKGKQGIYEAVKADIIKRYIVEADSKNSLPGDSFNAFIEHLLGCMFKFYRDNPTMIRLANWGRLEGDIDPWPGEDEWHHIYRERIRMAQQRGEIRNDLTPLNISIMICGAVHIWWEYHEHFFKHMNAKKKKDKTVADDFYLQQCLSFVIRGLSCDIKISKKKKSPKKKDYTLKGK